MIDRIDSQNKGDQTKLNAFFTALPSADSEGPSDQQVFDYIREDLERGRSEVGRHFNISRGRAKRLVTLLLLVLLLFFLLVFVLTLVLGMLQLPLQQLLLI